MNKTYKILLLAYMTILSLNLYCQDLKVICKHLGYTNPEARYLYSYNPENYFMILTDFESYTTCEGAELAEYKSNGEFSNKFDTSIEFESNWFQCSMTNIKSDTVSIFVYNKKDSTLVKKFDYKYEKYKYLPLKAQLGYLKDSLVTINEILKQNELICFLENSYVYRYYLISSCCLKIVSNNKTIYNFQKIPPLFKDDIKNLIRDIEPGSKLIFYDILATCPNCITRKLPEIEYTIIEKK